MASAGIVSGREGKTRAPTCGRRIGSSRTADRGEATTPIPLPEGFAAAPDVLGLGVGGTAAFCLATDRQAFLSRNPRDLGRPGAVDRYRSDISVCRDRLSASPAVVAADLHAADPASRLAGAMAMRVIEVQHHHAHVAACMAQNGWPRDGASVLGVALDGLGRGDDGALWGGEFLLADYLGYRRVAALAPVAMPGAELAVREPWRNLYAHIRSAMGWEAFRYFYGGLPARALLEARPIRDIDEMIATGKDAPPASSCGRLIDAVAAALGLCDGRQSYDGEAAARLQALASQAANDPQPYPFMLRRGDGLPRLSATPMWRALFDDLAAGANAADAAASFYAGLAEAIAETACTVAESESLRTVALSGDCFENRLLLDAAARRLRAAGSAVLVPSGVPAGDAGLALGQVAVAAASLLAAAG